MVKKKKKGLSLRVAEEMVVTEAEVVEEAFWENNFIQGIFSFVIAFVVYLAEIYLYSINYVLAGIVFFVVLAVVFVAMRAVFKSKNKKLVGKKI